MNKKTIKSVKRGKFTKMTTITDDGMTDEVDWERAGEGGIIRTKTNEKSLTVRMTRTQQEKKNQCPKLSTTKNNFKKRVKKEKVG